MDIFFNTNLGFSDKTQFLKVSFFSSAENRKRKYKEKALPYTDCLKAYLKDKTVLAFCSLDSKESISKKTLMASDWLMFQAEILGVDFSSAELFAVTEKEGKISCAFLIQNKKIFIFTVESEALPTFTETDYKIMIEKLMP